MADLDLNLRFIASKNFDFVPTYDGEIHREDDGVRAMWWKGAVLPSGARYLIFGDWRTSERYAIIDGALLGEDAQGDVAEALRTVTKTAAEVFAVYQKAQDETKALLATARDPSGYEPPPYLDKKGLGAGAPKAAVDSYLVDPERPHAVLVPRVDLDRVPWTFERIHPSGDKEAQPGGRAEGTFSVVREAVEPRVVVVGEGWATVETIARAFDSETGANPWFLLLAAHSAKNLPAVAILAARKYPNADIVIAADNDAKLAGGNVGVAAAEKAREAIDREAGRTRTLVLPPKFGKKAEGSDWNDFMALKGWQALKNEWTPLAERAAQGVSLIASKAADKAEDAGTGARLSEGEQADLIAKQLHFDDWVQIGSGSAGRRDFFKWVGTHWEAQYAPLVMQAFARAAEACIGGNATTKRVDSLVKMLLTRMKVAKNPDKFFTCNPYSFNFKDGTVDIVRDAGSGRSEAIFREHRKDDGFTYVHQWSYQAANDLPRDGTFAEYLALRNQDGGPEQVRALKQMLGACLIPYSPRFFFCVGESDAGKSTVAILAHRLAGEAVCSSLSPTEWKGFALFTMAGKLVNIETDLAYTAPLNDDVMKKIRDRVPVTLDRKGRDHVRAPLPPLHIFCANRMPRSLEGNTGALNKRITILNFNRVPWEVKDPAGWIWMRDAGGVLDAALEGLADLLANDWAYAVPKDSLEAIVEWQADSDPLITFMNEARDGELSDVGGRLVPAENGQVRISAVLERFRGWARESGLRKTYTLQIFGRELRRRGFEIKKGSDGCMVLAGWDIQGGPVEM